MYTLQISSPLNPMHNKGLRPICCPGSSTTMPGASWSISPRGIDSETRTGTLELFFHCCAILGTKPGVRVSRRLKLLSALQQCCTCPIERQHPPQPPDLCSRFLQSGQAQVLCLPPRPHPRPLQRLAVARGVQHPARAQGHLTAVHGRLCRHWRLLRHGEMQEAGTPY
jgi:hypothetical protein